MADPQPPAPRPAGRLLATAASGHEKAAVLLLTLGPEAAAQVMRCLSESEVRAVSAAMARIRTIPKPEAAAVHEEAWRWLTSREGFLVVGERFVRGLITQVASPGQQQAMRELARPAEAEGGNSQLARQLDSVQPAVVAKVLAAEHPQVIAFVLGNLGARQAADVLALLPEEQQSDLVQRIAELKTVSADLLAEVSAVITGQVASLGGAAMQSGSQGASGTKLAADIMNLVDKGVEARVFCELDDQSPELAENIRNLMLTFEDLGRLDNREMQILLKEVAREDLMLALKTASPTMSEKIFRNISARAAEILQEDMSTMGPVRLKDVEKAQGNIIAVARRLSEEQKIQLGGGGDDALV